MSIGAHEKVAVHEKTRSLGRAFLLWTAVMLGGCHPASKDPSLFTPPEGVKQARIEDTVARYENAANAQDRYERCMTLYFPNYDEILAADAEGPYLGRDKPNGPMHPALEGCGVERSDMYRLRRIAMGDQE